MAGGTEVISSLNERWSFMGATAIEWAGGFVSFIVCAEFVDKIARGMPLLLTAWFLTTFSLAALRRRFPDQDRGLRNWCMMMCGIEPLDIPAPAKMQPYWSSMPIRGLKQGCHYNTLELDQVFRELELERQADRNN